MVGVWLALVLATLARAEEGGGSLMAYVGTFSSPLGDVLPTQVDLPPGNGRGIHCFAVDRQTGRMNEVGTFRWYQPQLPGASADGRRIYSANETDRVGGSKEGSVSSFEVNPKDGSLKLLNTVRSGGAGRRM